MKTVIIAHQSSIPHYRICFYNAIEKLRPDTWKFEVVFDRDELTKKQFFKEDIDPDSFKFPIHDVDTIFIKGLGRKVCYQTFWRAAKHYDLIVVEQAVNNLAYPLCQLHQLWGTKFAYWGSGRDRNTANPSKFKQLLESTKALLTRKADGFFAYTPGVEDYMQAKGVDPKNIFVLNNTVDIEEHRTVYEKYRLLRDESQKELGIYGKKVLLFVGRFTKVKRIEFLLEAFSILTSRDPDFHLLLIGSGGDAYLSGEEENITYFGTLSSISELEKMAKIYAASDLFAFPGLVGLAPLTALCYDLPTMTIAAADHKPEFEYLNSSNSLVLDAETSPEQFAEAIQELFSSQSNQLQSLKENAWPSICHLTIDNMAKNFIEGVNALLD